MKLLALSNLFPRPWDKTRATYNQKIFSEISRRCDLTLLVPVPWTEIFKFPRQYFRARRDSTEIWPFVHYFPYLYIPRLSQGLNAYFLLFSVLLFCPIIVAFRQWDAVLGSWIYPDSIVAVMLGRLRKKATLAVALGTDINDLANRGMQRHQIQQYLEKCSSVLTVSNDLARKVAALGVEAAKIHTIYNGIDGDSFKPQDKLVAKQKLGFQDDCKIILFVGNLIKEKGCFELIQSFSDLVRTNEQYKLVLIGGGPIRAELEVLVTKLHLSSSVTFVGKVLHDALPDWFGSADIFCLPSYREGIPNVVMEALASGVPVVATSVGGIPEIVDSDCGVLVDAHSVTDLTAGLQKAIERKWNSEAIATRVKQYTWSATGDAYIHQIQQAIKHVSL
jgi:glycosyltransferase involved in cell wall biosynthesis